MTDSTEHVPRPRTGGRLGAWAALLGLGWVVLVLVALLVGRSLRAPPAPLALAVTFLPYLMLAAVTWVFATWCAFPDRRSAPALLGVVLVALAGAWGPSWRQSEGLAGEPLRVMTWNVRRLWGGSDDAVSPARCVLEAVEGAEPDVLVLQEISAEELEGLGGPLGLTCAHTDYRGQGSTRRGGVAVCTRGDRWSLASGQAQPFRDDEAWRFLFAEVEREGLTVNVLGVHLHPYWPLTAGDLRDGVRDLARGRASRLIDFGQRAEEVVRVQGSQSVALLERVARLEDPTILAGDFNSTRDSALHTGLRQTLRDVFASRGRGFGGTVHVLGRFPLRIDYVYATPGLGVDAATVPSVGCSDHRPVLADLTVARGAGR